MDNLINIQNRNGILTVTSREIAENFDKRHDKLTSEIERKYGEYIVDEKECPRNGGNLLFIRSTYIHPQNNQEMLHHNRLRPQQFFHAKYPTGFPVFLLLSEPVFPSISVPVALS